MNEEKSKIDDLVEIFLSSFEVPENESYDTHEGGYMDKSKLVETDDAIYELVKEKKIDFIDDKDRLKLFAKLNKETPRWVRK